MTQTTDPRELHQRAMTQTGSIVAAVEPGQLTLPTPCPEYDVRALLSHMVGGLNRIAVVGEGGDGIAVDPRADGVPAVAQRILPPEPRGGAIPFGPVRLVPPDAGRYAQLAAWLGRQP